MLNHTVIVKGVIGKHKYHIFLTYTTLSCERGRFHILKEDANYDAAQDVWKDLPNCKIVSTFVSTYNIAG